MARPHALIRRGPFCVLACFLVSAVAGATSPARAAPQSPPTFTVNSPADVPAGGDLTNGVCQTAPGNGVCTLRAAIMKANHWPGGNVIIRLPALPSAASYVLTIPASGVDDETTGDLHITHQTGVVSMIGDGAGRTIIDANAGVTHDRAFYVEIGAALVLSGTTVQGGHPDPGNGGGGIFDDGNLTLYDAIIAQNQAYVFGGGIESRGTLAAFTSTISSNQVFSNGIGGGLANAGPFTMTLVATTISSNAADTGGGIGNFQAAPLTLVGSTLSGNLAQQDGGGLAGRAATLINSTVSGNRANRDGGGIWNGELSFGLGVLKLYNVTVANNQADADLNGTGTGGGVFNEPLFGDTVQLQNSLLSDNLASAFNSFVGYYFVPDDCAGSLTSLDYNLVSHLTAGCTFLASPHDQLNAAAHLGSLEDNGGPTWTQALLPGSPAIDAGNPGGCTDPLGAPLTTDQRGFPRPAFGGHSFRCDIGAYELQQLGFLPLLIK